MIFSRKSKEDKEFETRRAAVSIIANGTLLTGELAMEGELHFNGAMEGNISARKIILGEHAKVAGSISSDTIEIYGSVIGDIMARTVKLGSSAIVKGSITQERIIIESGAILDGRCHRVDDPIEAGSPEEDLLITDQHYKK